MTPTITQDTLLGPMQVYEQGTITRALQNGQWWDAHLKPFIDEAAERRGTCAVDIGAHFGWFSVYMAQKFAQVYACEPWPETFQLLQQNVYTRADNVQCWPVAAYTHVRALGFSEANDLTDTGSFAFEPGELDNPLVVGVPLDTYLPAWANVSLVKSDAQGADLQALLGMRRMIRRCRPLIVFEWEAELANRCFRSTWQDYEEFFRGLDYHAPERITTSFWDYVARPK